MLISDAHRFLFVHVQKTGGVSFGHLVEPFITDARQLPGLTRHARLDQILAREPALSSYLVVGFVRNPWARLVSWYRMVERFERIAAQGGEKAQRFLTGKQFIASVARDYADFGDFVMRGPEDWERLRQPQLAYLTAPGRRADFIARQETYDDDAREILRRLDLPTDLVVPRDNAAPQETWRRYYTPALVDRVADVYAADIEEFGYQFD